MLKIITHKLSLLFIFVVCQIGVTHAQIGINTTDPEGALDIVSTDQGVVMPRVSAVENVTTPDGNPAVDGTIVYDVSRGKMCMRISGSWLCTDAFGSQTIVFDGSYSDLQAYVKASNTDAGDQFGISASISSDGNYLAIGAYRESSNATGINGNQSDNSASNTGAVYIYVRNASTWTQQAYIKASNAEANDFFGTSVDLSSDGTYLVVGANGEDSNATGINGNESDNSESSSGAAYVFVRSGTTWTQQAYIKASNAENNDIFGQTVSISDDGSYLAVSGAREDSNATGINGNESDNSEISSGAVYIFIRSGTTWSQQAYIKASNTESLDYFGDTLSLSADGFYLAVGAREEDSNATGINGNESDNSEISSGAVYIFVRSGTTWSQQAYIKASNTEADDSFGYAVSLSGDGSYVAITANQEDSSATTINGNQTNNNNANSGAAYVFARSGTTWTQIAYVKAFNADTNDFFGRNVAFSGNGNRLVISASSEDSNATGVGGDFSNNDASGSGAVYSFIVSGTSVTFNGYIKASNTGAGDIFGNAIDLNVNGNTLVVSANSEDSNATGIGGDQSDDSAFTAGAAYIYE